MSLDQVKAAVDTIDTALDASSKAIDVYNKAVDQVIPWGTFEQASNDLSEHAKSYSERAAGLVGDVKVKLEDCSSEYFKASQSVYEWCLLCSRALVGYIKLLDDGKRAEGVKAIVLKVLEVGEKALTDAQANLHESSKSFNSALGKLNELIPILESDYDSQSTYFKGQVAKIRKEAYGGAAVGFVFGPFGAAISYGIAAGVAEGDLIPKLKEQLAKVKKRFQSTKTLIDTTIDAINDAKAKLEEQITILGDMKADVQETALWVSLDDVLLDLLKESANRLIEKCNNFVRERSRKLN